MNTENSIMTPREIVEELDQYIVGQKAAKKSVALALRNRYRRMKLDDELKKEVTPKNILMIGPTGVGKTEIARRIATLSKAPFIKVEATKFTEVGYVGKEVDSIIRDLTEVSARLVKEEAIKKEYPYAEKEALEKVLNILLPGTESEVTTLDSDPTTRDKIRKKLIRGEMDDVEIEVSLPANVGVEVMAPPGMEEMSQFLSGLSSQLGQLKHKKRKVKVKEAIPLLTEIEAAKRINEEEIKAEALIKVQESGIVFIDEIDKICKGSKHNADVNREGVQRDLLPLIEGCSVNTKFGVVNTDHILFITSGAFHISKPSDLIPELQGRLPVRVELDELTVDEFTRILQEPRSSLIKQYQALIGTENVELTFSTEAIIEIAKIAFDINKKIENIGARRLQTVMEKLLEDISFSAGEKSSDSFNIDVDYVREQLGNLVKDEDLSRYML